LVVESDPDYTLINEAIGEELYPWRRKKKKYTLTNKAYDLQDDNEIEYKVVGEKMVDMEGKLLSPKGRSGGGVVAFVLMQNGSLRIGSKHTGLSKGHTVLMAGELQIINGEVKYMGNESGHYMPELLEEVRGLKYLHRLFPWIKITAGNIGKHLPEKVKDDEEKGKIHASMKELLRSDNKKKRRELKQDLEKWHL
jgi:hypothetical protein